ncbi:MFS transporter-like protein [Cucurbitaria berberidis CBS 394.84]|uniref:MFS transporter-like protein n=1 Tax=Cucurbitaria berberidis CBS 394.84 TaxID=1168544 RepID=A0A9P4G8F7_9PLEO|nr:MFS transporter-like protein [Cucurbitaria berberidis CBS 394.84]KAF1840640.1 MFS transporter-like protein [Cucurbitaria berberidis CBS 394.84]
MDGRLAFKIAAAMYSFSTLGLFNSSIGAVLPLLSHHYNLTDLHVSLIFLAGPIGYVIAAQCSDTVHDRFGQRGVAVVGPLLQLVATGIVAAHWDSFGVVLCAFAIQGLGTGLLDGSWCAWAATMPKANTISGLLHGSYSLGGAAGPFLVTVITTQRRAWWVWYYVLAGASFLEFVVLVSAFRNETASAYHQTKQFRLTHTSKISTKAIFRYPATWLCAAYFLTYVGTETAISGWIVSFMLRNRGATPYIAGLSSSGYWVGMAFGRLILGFATDGMGVRRATGLYFIFALGIEVLFAVLSSAAVSVALMTLLGFFMGPLFPSGVVVLTRLLPGELHVAAVSFVASLGQVGGAFLPFAIGAVVQSLGIGVFRFAILVQTFLALLVWYAFARLRQTVLPLLAARNED